MSINHERPCTESKSVATHRHYSAHSFCCARSAFTYRRDHTVSSSTAGARSRTMKRIPCRACSSKLEPSKVVASFCFLNSPYQRFAEAFADLSGILSPFHSSICSCTTGKLSATERRQTGQWRHTGSKAPVLLVPRDVTKRLKGNTRRLTSIFNSYATLYCYYIRGLDYLRMATRTTKTAKV